MKIDRFSIGFGRAIAKLDATSTGVEWRIGWMPLGGYVRFAGDETPPASPTQDDLDAMRRDLVAREGPGAETTLLPLQADLAARVDRRGRAGRQLPAGHRLFAACCSALSARPSSPPRVGAVDAGQPGRSGRLPAGRPDRSASTAARSTTSTTCSSIVDAARRRADPLRGRARRRGSVDADRDAAAQRRRRRPGRAGSSWASLGIGLAQRPRRLRSRRYGPVEAVGGGVEQTWRRARDHRLLPRPHGHRPGSADQLRGPLRHRRGRPASVAKQARGGATGPAASWSATSLNLLQLAALISVGIGFMNLLPVPVLDGGHLLFYAYEAVARGLLRPRFRRQGTAWALPCARIDVVRHLERSAAPACVQVLRRPILLSPRLPPMVHGMIRARPRPPRRVAASGAASGAGSPLASPVAALAQRLRRRAGSAAGAAAQRSRLPRRAIGVVQRILVQGNERIEPSTVVSYLPVQAGRHGRRRPTSTWR